MLWPISVPHDMIAAFQFLVVNGKALVAFRSSSLSRFHCSSLRTSRSRGCVLVVGHWALRWAGALTLVSQPPVSRNRRLVMFLLYTGSG